jgi:hypothetical protein
VSGFLGLPGVDINYQKNSFHKNTLLANLISNESTGKAITLIQLFADKINFTLQDAEGKTLLLFAVKTLKTDLVITILAVDKSSLDIADEQGKTPLHYACILGLAQVARMLVANGANTKRKDQQGFTPAHYLQSSHKLIIATLNSVGIDYRRHPEAPRNGFGDRTQRMVLLTREEIKRVRAIPTKSLSYDNPNKLYEILLCAESVPFIKHLISFRMDKKNFTPAYLAMLNYIAKFPTTLLDACLAGRKEVKKVINPVATAQQYFNDGNLNQTFFYLSLANKIKNPRRQAAQQKLHAAASEQLQSKRIEFTPEFLSGLRAG